MFYGGHSCSNHHILSVKVLRKVDSKIPRSFIKTFPQGNLAIVLYNGFWVLKLTQVCKFVHRFWFPLPCSSIAFFQLFENFLPVYRNQTKNAIGSCLETLWLISLYQRFIRVTSPLSSHSCAAHYALGRYRHCFIFVAHNNNYDHLAFGYLSAATWLLRRQGPV